jgi:hypothetical protein
MKEGLWESHKCIEPEQSRAEIEMALAHAVKARYAEGGVEYMVGAMSSITSIEQLESLLESLKH